MKIIKVMVLIFISLLPIIIFGNRKYVELNNLAIIEGIGVECDSNIKLYLQEVIPIKSDAGIKYQYKYLSSEANNIDNAFIKIKKNNKKTIYTNKVKYIVTNCKSSKKVREYFKINNITIYHNKNVLSKLKEIIN